MGPRPIGAVVLGVTERIGHKALAYHLDQAARLTGTAAARARREADAIAELLALPEPSPLPDFAERARGEAA